MRVSKSGGILLVGLLCVGIQVQAAEEQCYRSSARGPQNVRCGGSTQSVEDCAPRQRRVEDPSTCTFGCEFCGDDEFQDQFTDCTTCLNCTTEAKCPNGQVIVTPCERNANAVCGCPAAPPCPTEPPCPTCPPETPCPPQTPCPTSPETSSLTPCPAVPTCNSEDNLAGTQPSCLSGTGYIEIESAPNMVETVAGGASSKAVTWNEDELVPSRYTVVNQSHSPGDNFMVGSTLVTYILTDETKVNLILLFMVIIQDDSSTVCSLPAWLCILFLAIVIILSFIGAFFYARWKAKQGGYQVPPHDPGGLEMCGIGHGAGAGNGARANVNPAAGDNQGRNIPPPVNGAEAIVVPTAGDNQGRNIPLPVNGAGANVAPTAGDNQGRNIPLPVNGAGANVAPTAGDNQGRNIPLPVNGAATNVALTAGDNQGRNIPPPVNGAGANVAPTAESEDLDDDTADGSQPHQQPLLGAVGGEPERGQGDAAMGEGEPDPPGVLSSIDDPDFAGATSMTPLMQPITVNLPPSTHNPGHSLPTGSYNSDPVIVITGDKGEMEITEPEIVWLSEKMNEQISNSDGPDIVGRKFRVPQHKIDEIRSNLTLRGGYSRESLFFGVLMEWLRSHADQRQKRRNGVLRKLKSVSANLAYEYAEKVNKNGFQETDDLEERD